VKLLLVEEGSNEARALWNAEGSLVTSWITFAEVSAAIGAASRNRRISRRRATESVRALHAEWSSVVALEVDEVTSRRAGDLAMRYGLRGMDSIHLASVALLAVAQPTLVTWDADMRGAALAEGLDVASL
jgi:predicted nucleic acid-binding protein